MKLYCGTYAKYNAGSLKGAWMDLDDYADADAFEEACRELHKDEADPELMFQDYDTDGDDWTKSLYAESSIPSSYWEIKDELDRTGLDPDAFAAYLENIHSGEITAEVVETAADAYRGQMSLADYAEELAEECGDLENVPEWIKYCIDWEKAGRDLELGGDVTNANGYLFAN